MAASPTVVPTQTPSPKLLIQTPGMLVSATTGLPLTSHGAGPVLMVIGAAKAEVANATSPSSASGDFMFMRKFLSSDNR